MSRLFKLTVIESWLLRMVSRVLVGAAFAAMSGCSPPCGNELVSAQSSPDGRIKAVVFTRDCGATVRTDTSVSVLPANADLPKGLANALVVRDDPDHPIARTFSAIEVRLNWTSSRRLSVSFPRAAVVGRRAVNVNGVVIDYGTF